jgi:hypothetical protein
MEIGQADTSTTLFLGFSRVCTARNGAGNIGHDQRHNKSYADCIRITRKNRPLQFRLAWRYNVRRRKNMNDQFSGVVRHVLTIAAGVLIQRGVLDESSAEAIIGGVIAILGVVWSWRSKKPTA